ncbi:MAG: response regulator [Deltaproteobacteria bacterium]|nr:response regulator [Deltaproteobacteria bacterium]MBW2648243.1 response regulator [Deltaproteobacteria bacterium]
MTAKGKILLIDDDRDFLMATRLIFEKSGYEVFLAESGKSGLDMIQSISPDLAIVDMMMETWGEGFDVISKIRSMDMGKDMPLIVLSAVDLQGPYQSYQPSDEFPKVNMVLHKPVKADDLIRYVGELIG